MKPIKRVKFIIDDLNFMNSINFEMNRETLLCKYVSFFASNLANPLGDVTAIICYFV